MLNERETRQYLKESDFENLFTQELGWDHHTQTLNITVDETEYQLTAIVEKRGMAVFECPAPQRKGVSRITQPAARSKNRSQSPSTNTLSSTPMLRKPRTSGSGSNASKENPTHAVNTGITVTNNPVNPLSKNCKPLPLLLSRKRS